MTRKTAAVLAALLLTAGAALADTAKLTLDGNGRATLTSTYVVFVFMEYCARWEPEERPCGDQLDFDGDGVQERWAVVGGHCTTDEAELNTSIRDAAAYSARLTAAGITLTPEGGALCDEESIDRRFCRGPSVDPELDELDQTGFTISSPPLCQDFFRAHLVDLLHEAVDEGFLMLQRKNDPRPDPQGGLPD